MRKFLSLMMAMMLLASSAFATTIYCKMDKAWWKADGAAVAVHHWGGETAATTWPGVRMTPVEGDADVWSYDVPADVTGLIFVRVNGSGNIADWGAKTADLTLQTDGKNLYTITSETPVWGNPGVTGEWSTYTPGETPEPTPKQYYAKYAPNWEYKLMTEAAGMWLTDTIVYKGIGININDVASGDGLFYSNEEIEGARAIAGAAIATNDTLYFSFNPADSVLTAVMVGKYVEPVAPVAHYYLAGTMNDWTIGATEFVAGNEDTLSVSVALAADSVYEFKIVKVLDTDTVWFGNMEAATMVYGNSTGWWLKGEANVGLQTTSAADYLFIFKANENNEISVVIPEPAPAPKQYYAKYAPNWEYKLMTEAAGMWLTDTIVYKGIGININDVADGDGLFYSNEEIEGARAIAGAAIATNDTIYFSFNPADSVLTAVMVGQYVEPVAPVAHYYLAGTMNNWTIGATEFVAGNEDTLSVSVALAADSVYEFKIVKVLDTDTVWFGNMEAATMVYGNSTGWWLKGEANVGLQTTSAADYLFIFKANENNEISVVIPEPAPAPKQYYAKYAPNWEYKLMAEAAGMWLTDTIVYKGIGININDVASGDGLFYSNEKIEGARAIAGAAIATNDTLYFSFNPADSVLTAVMVGKYVEPVAPVAHYYLAGTMNDWTIGATEFVAGNEDTLSVSVALAADSVYEFKIVKVLDTDTVWFGNMEAATMVYGNSTGWWLKGDANVGLQTTSAADYLFIFKANENNEISVVIPEPAPAPKQYYAKYAPNWEYKLMAEAAGMWLTDTIVYKGIGININDVASGDGLFYSNEEIEGARAIAGAAIATNDTLYFSFNPADSVLTAVMVGQYVEPVAPVAHYYLAGTMNEWTIGATEFVAGNEDTLSVSVALAADSVYEFKIVKVLDTDTVWFGNTEAATMVYGNSTGWWLKGEANVGLQTTSAADYLFIFKANENNEISVVIPEPETPQPQLENGYYLVGKFGGVDAWNVADLSAEKRFAQNPENESEYMLAINLDVNDEIKVVYVENDAIQTWFPAEGENYVINDHHNGATTMFFRPDCQGGEGWFAGCIYVVPTSTVGVENTNAVIEAVKVVRNGQILIIRGEHSYTVMGQMIK